MISEAAPSGGTKNWVQINAGSGTGRLASMITESYPDVSIIATDVSFPLCGLAAKHCRVQPVLVMRTPTSQNPPVPFLESAFDVVLNRLAPMDPVESFRLLPSGGRAVIAEFIDANWQEIRRVFPEVRIIKFSRGQVTNEIKNIFKVDFLHVRMGQVIQFLF